MNFWRDLNVKMKIMTLVAACCVGLAVVGIVGVLSLSKMSRDEAELRDGMAHIAVPQDMKSLFLSMRLDLVYMLVFKDAAKIDEKGKDFIACAEAIRTKLDIIEKSKLNTEEKALLQGLRQGVEAYVTEGRKLAGMAKAAQSSGNAQASADALRFATDTVAPLYTKPAGIISEMVTSNIKEGEVLYQSSLSDYRRSRLVLLAVIISAMTIALVVGYLIANSISLPLQSVFETLKEVAGGNLSASSAIDSRDEMGMLAREVNQTAVKLNEIIALVARNSEQVASAATELHTTAAEMATGAEEMAAQAGTVATASEEMSATSGDIAQSCHSAANGALDASKTAQVGSGVVENTIQVMGRIAGRVKNTAQSVESLGARSDQIGEIIGTIQDIADQTNLLALNAAIEAARAGEQGRGFAVVADEVRALAERTTKATREIGEMIKTIQRETKEAVVAMDQGVKEVESGTVEAAKSGEALQGILEQINNVNMQVSQIATAAEEQTATTSEISSNIQQINDVVQHTARGAHESVIAANRLNGLAGELQMLVSRFRLA